MGEAVRAISPKEPVANEASNLHRPPVRVVPRCVCDRRLSADLSVFLPSFLRVPSVMTKWADGTRGFQWDGVFLMLALLVLILLIEVLRKRIRSAPRGRRWPWRWPRSPDLP